MSRVCGGMRGNMRIKIIWGFFCALFLTVQLGVKAQEVSPEVNVSPESDLSLYATAAVLMDGDTGRVLYGKAADTPMAMASTTKILTCILVLENVSLEETLEVSAYAASMPKVKLNLQKGEQYTVGDLLYSLMLESHNDSAVALAEHVGKRLLDPPLADKPAGEYTREESQAAVAAFARLMNEKAVELGCRDSWFITPNGLDATQELTLQDGTVIQKEHCTTAAELARIMSYCVLDSPRKEDFLKITRTANYSFYANGRSFSCVNHNAFLNMMDGALSGKTGFTNKAGYCYVGALERDGRTFVVALLACGWPNHKTWKWSDTKELMEYGLENYFYRSFDEEGTVFDETLLKPVRVLHGQTNILGETAYAEIAVAGTEQIRRESVENGAGRAMNPEAGAQESDGGGEANGVTGKQEDRTGRRENWKADEQEDGGRMEQDVEGLLMRADEEIQVEYSWEKTLAAPVERGTQVGEIRYIVDGVVYKRERIVAVDTVDEICFEWCLRQVLGRFLFQ